MTYLSYFISADTPLYGNADGIQFEKEKSINSGDSCNTMQYTLPNHCGTHIDFPYHFDQHGKKTQDYPPTFWRFINIQVIDISKTVSDQEIIKPDIFPGEGNYRTEILLIKTGYGNYRGTDRYTLSAPGLSPLIPAFLRKMYPNLRCIGVDLISITSYNHRKIGREAHKAFLKPDKGNPILILEDMRLKGLKQVKKIIVAPLLIENADGVPCTVFAW